MEVPEGTALTVRGWPVGWDVYAVPPCAGVDVDPGEPWVVRTGAAEQAAGVVPVVLRERAGGSLFDVQGELTVERIRALGSTAAPLIESGTSSELNILDSQLTDSQNGVYARGALWTSRVAVACMSGGFAQGKGLDVAHRDSVQIVDTLVWGNQRGVLLRSNDGATAQLDGLMVIGNGRRDIKASFRGGMSLSTNNAAVASFSSSIIAHNHGTEGAGLDIGEGVTVVNVGKDLLRIEYNVASHAGGGVQLAQASLKGARIAHNVASVMGGGVYAGGVSEIEGTEIVDNAAPVGCGIYVAPMGIFVKGKTGDMTKLTLDNHSRVEFNRCDIAEECPQHAVGFDSVIESHGTAWSPMTIRQDPMTNWQLEPGCVSPTDRYFTVRGFTTENP